MSLSKPSIPKTSSAGGPSSAAERTPLQPLESSTLKAPTNGDVRLNQGNGGAISSLSPRPPSPPKPVLVPGPATAPKPPANGGIAKPLRCAPRAIPLFPSLPLAPERQLVLTSLPTDSATNGFQKPKVPCPHHSAGDILDSVIVDCKVAAQAASHHTQVLNHKNQDMRAPAASSTGGEVSTEQVGGWYWFWPAWLLHT